VELKDRRIRSNVLSPGPTDTPQVTRQPMDAIARIVSTIPMGRMGEPDEVAKARYFWPRMTPVLSRASNYSLMVAERKSKSSTDLLLPSDLRQSRLRFLQRFTAN
jgi:NAD(P)-dependent dehydrogenase (short-subunit alcohol dehydrogenase family)